MDRACARARCWEHHYNQPQGGLVWAFFAEHSGPSFSFIILSAVHLITKERHVLMGIVGVCLWTARARARVRERHHNQPGWAGLGIFISENSGPPFNFYHPECHASDYTERHV